eukprot:CAMPEP_0172668558 /NCGR_PEP_ID=MMETSP1074-20121228/9137_1 /TAXON_ID=2916 /ORGANISM="Ceratium fusus, Strain PA161109" /LENGTH=268 /DNA_ID=CAMNT_0013485221 /DNA_START=73 /DNA_END=879 /DNA_ORIENTATION=-
MGPAGLLVCIVAASVGRAAGSKCYSQVSATGKSCSGPTLVEPNPGQVGSMSECKSLCDSHSACRHVTYYSGMNRCYEYVASLCNLQKSARADAVSSSVIDCPGKNEAFEPCEKFIKHCGGAAGQECTVTYSSSRTDTSDWSVCAGASVSGGLPKGMTAEVHSEVCASGSKEVSSSVEHSDTISTEPKGRVAVCQQGKHASVDGKTYLRIDDGFLTHSGKTCELSECPRPGRVPSGAISGCHGEGGHGANKLPVAFAVLASLAVAVRRA